MKRVIWAVLTMAILAVGAIHSAAYAHGHAHEYGHAHGHRFSETGQVIVGAIFPFSGAEADIGMEYLRSIEMALDDAGATHIKVIYQDSAGREDVARAAFERLADHGADVVMTVQSWVSNAISPLAAERDIAHVVLGSAVFDRQGATNAIRFTVDFGDEARFLTENLFDAYERIAIVHMDNDYGRGWTRQLRELLGERVVAAQGYPLDSSSFASQIAAVKSAAPDLLFLLSTSEGAKILREARAAGISAQTSSNRPIERPEIAAESAAEGLIYSAPLWNANHPFVSRYAKLYGEAVTVFGAEGYDAMSTLARAVKGCGADADCIYGWYTGRSYEGVLGPVTFDAVGDAHYGFVLNQVTGGAFLPWGHR